MSTPELLGAYLRQRLRPRVLVLLALVLAAAGWCLSPSAGFDPGALFIATAQAFILTLAFRVWDDLEDRHVDRARHPDRVLPQSNRVAPFVTLTLGLGLAGTASLFLLADPLKRLIALAIATGMLSIWYASRQSENSNRIAGGLIVLLKYPLIAFAVAPTLADATPVRSVAVLTTVYAIICAYEYTDDAELRHIISTRRSLP